MFEKLLEHILTKYFGKYIEGLNGKNLKMGVWSGNVLIQNVKVKASTFDELNLPIELKFSHIGKF